MWASNWSWSYPFNSLQKLIAQDNQSYTVWTKSKTPEIDFNNYLFRAVCFVVDIHLLYNTIINDNEFDLFCKHYLIGVKILNSLDHLLPYV